ncbi:hypothetical protein K2X92_03155 [Candidatus Gracilibacteria bacterium]|nr:hypothetical protein [Candidatus Gracilibacteria bacterium]
MRAHILYRHYEEQMEISIKEELDEKTKEFAKVRFWLYLDLWYGSLVVLIEVYKKMGIKDGVINKLLKSKNLKLLIDYRNSIFHFHEDDNRQQKFYEETSTVNWVRETHSEFNRFFLEKIKNGELQSD